MNSLIEISSGIGSVLYFVAAVSCALILGRVGFLLLVALLSTALWSLVAGLHPTFDFLLAAIWSSVLIAILRHHRSVLLVMVPFASVAGAALALFWTGPPFTFYLIMFCFVGTLLLIEQLIRESEGLMRAVGFWVGALFLLNLYVYASGVFNGQISAGLLKSRDLASASISLALVLTPFFVSAGERKRRIGMSRRTAITTTSLALAGALLLGVAVVGYLFRLAGGEYGDVLQHFIPFLIALSVGVFLASSTRRARIRVWINKHFFETKYDYNLEWRSLSERLAYRSGQDEFAEVALGAVLPILNAAAGAIYIRTGDERFVPYFDTGMRERPRPLEGRRHPAFIKALEYNWIFTPQTDHGGFGRLNDELPPVFTEIDDLTIVLPLQGNDSLIGFILICSDPAAAEDFDWEDLDLLRMAAKQVASFVGYQMLNEEAVVSRQFEAFHQFTTFVMHDLKNLVAQQGLVVDNAARFIDKPEFVRDAIDTIDNSVKRMQRMIQKLSNTSASNFDKVVEVSLVDTARDVVARQQADSPVPELQVTSESVTALADKESLAMAFTHLVKNAQDACDGKPEGRVTVEVIRTENEAVCRIVDNGQGMDADFVRHRLFRPFDSTKSTKGMGVGAFQCRQIIERFGGSLDVDSKPGEGTTMTARFPLCEAREGAAEA